jgi:hypothetical protein
VANTAVAPSTADLSGNFMETYGDSLKDLIPMNTQLIKRVPFEERTKVANVFHQPVVVKTEHGFTYAAPNMGAFALGGFSSLQTKDATVDGANLVLASAIDYESAARASVSKAAFAEVTGLKVKHMTANTRKRLEISSWYGQSGLGTISAKGAVVSNTIALTITQANFAPLIWAGAAGALVVVDNGSGTQWGGGGGIFFIQKVNVADGVRTVTLGDAGASGAPTLASGETYGTVAQLNTDLGTPNDAARIFFKSSVNFSSFAHADMLGVHGQLTTTGSVLGIDNTVWDQWAPNSFAVGGALNYKGVNDGVAQAVSRGLDEDMEVFLSYRTFGNVAADMAALRVIDQNYDPKKAVVGNESVEFHGLSGTIKLTPSGYVKQGFAYGLPIKDMVRVGATDLTFSTPGSKGGDIFFQLPSNAGFGMRCYSHQGIAVLAPSKAVVFTGIVNA